jgi:hypothetical protein
MKIALIISVILLLLIIWIILKAFCSTAKTFGGVFDALSGGMIGVSIKMEKKKKYKESFLARLFHKHEWEPKLDNTLHYSKTEKTCYICGASK